MSDLVLHPFEKSLEKLKEIFLEQPESEVLQDAILLRFQCCLEMIWRTSKRVIESRGLVIESPKSIIVQLEKVCLIEDAKIWIGFIDAKNLILKEFNRTTAQEVISKMPSFIDASDKLLENLRKMIRS